MVFSDAELLILILYNCNTAKLYVYVHMYVYMYNTIHVHNYTHTGVLKLLITEGRGGWDTVGESETEERYKD